MRSRSIRLVGLFAAVLTLSTTIPPSHAQTDCAAVSCVYLPAVRYEPVYIVESHHFRTKYGNRVMGQIRNSGSRPVYAVTLEALSYE